MFALKSLVFALSNADGNRRRICWLSKVQLNQNNWKIQCEDEDLQLNIEESKEQMKN